MNFRLSSLILLLHIQGSLTLDNFIVTCNKQNICAAMGTWVTVRCSYSNINIKTGFWFSQKQRTNWRNKDEPEDLTLDSDYSGRVNQEITEDYSKLIISDVIDRDSGEYQLMFIMKDGVKHLSSVTVNLTVSVLQVKMNPESTGQRVKLSCDSSCPKTSEYDYYWYKNGQHLTYNQNIFVSSSENTDSYYCSESDSDPSSSICLSNSSCWGVTYTSRRVCALVGSTVDIHSSYSHPTGYTVNKTYWHYYHHGELSDLREDHQFSGRVEFVGNTLRVKDVSTNDTGIYRFSIITKTSDEVFGSHGVDLTVTDTRVISSPDPVIDGEKVILSCSTGCTLDNKHTYIWYKNGQQVTDGLRLLNKLYLDSNNSEELQEYSCTVRDSMDKTTKTTDRNNEEADCLV
nr:sialoadhesin-like [Misgurnus anguillicaudatus]